MKVCQTNVNLLYRCYERTALFTLPAKIGDHRLLYAIVVLRLKLRSKSKIKLALNQRVVVSQYTGESICTITVGYVVVKPIRIQP